MAGHPLLFRRHRRPSGRVHVPAALLLGPMLAGIAITAAGGTARVPNAAFSLPRNYRCMIAKVVRCPLPARYSAGGRFLCSECWR